VSSIKERTLTKKILAGMLGFSILTGGITYYYPHEVEAASLYEEYQKEQKLEELKKQVAEAKRQLDIAEKQKRAELKAQQEEQQKKKAELERKKADDELFKKAEAEIIKKAEENQKKYNGTGKSFPKVDEDEHPNNIVNRINKIIAENSKASKRQFPVKKGDESAAFVMDKAPNPSQSAEVVETNVPKMFASSGTTGNEKLYNFDWKGTPVAQSIYGVAKLAGKGVVVNAKLEGTVFLSLSQVTCDQALNYLANAFGLNWMTDGNNIIVSTGDLMKQSATFRVSYANKENLAKEFKAIGISEEGIFANNQTGTISVTGTPYQIAEARKRLAVIDKPVAQCLILAQLIEINHGKDVDLGISYNLPSYNHSADSKGTSGTLDGDKVNWLDKMEFGANVKADRTLSKGKVIARPMTLALNGQKGTVNFGDKVPVLTKTDTGSTTSVTVTYQDVGTKLEVTPTINEVTGEITMDIKTEVANITSWQTSGDTRAPQISSRTSETSTHVKSGQSFVIGGLMQTKDLDNLSGIPGLMNLPILGKLFSVHNRSKSYSEVFIMITPFILTDDINVRDIYDELKHIDSKAKYKDIVLPKSDWTNDIGKHRINHEIEEKAKK